MAVMAVYTTSPRPRHTAHHTQWTEWLATQKPICPCACLAYLLLPARIFMIVRIVLNARDLFSIIHPSKTSIRLRLSPRSIGIAIDD